MYNLQNDEYLKLNISLFKCTAGTSPHQQSIPTVDHGGNDHIFKTRTPSKPPLLQNVLGDNLFYSLQGLFVNRELDSTGDVHSPCNVINSMEVPISAAQITIWLLSFLLISVFLVAVCYVTMKWARLLWRTLRSEPYVKTNRVTTTSVEHDSDLELDSDVETDRDVEPDSDGECNESDGGNTRKKTQKAGSVGIHLSYQCQVCKDPSLDSGISVTTFLERTCDRLFKKLDKLLLRGLSDGQTLPQTCPATPRPVRRSLVRRQRVGSSPLLHSLNEATARVSESQENAEQEQAWLEFKHFSQKFEWNYPCTNKMESSTLGGNSQKLIRYFQRSCPIPQNRWTTATLVTNYVLYLISQELECIGCSKMGFRFVEFLGTGSAKYGTKIASPNSFDVLMVVQPPVMPDLVFSNSESGIPPGMVAVGVNSTNYSICDKKLASNIEIDGSRKLCLSAKEFAVAAESLIEECLQSLYTRSRSDMDRLPFQIKGAPTAGLMLNINTRTLVGFGDPEIRVKLIPVLPLPMNGWYQKPMLYATPPTAEYEYKQRSEMSRAINADVLWQIESSNFHMVFYSGVESLMKHSRVNSCHLVCLMLLKFLLTGCCKNSLLDRGVFPSAHISTVVNFLLLESAPNQWSYDKLGDRFSDAIHFLKSAYGSCRLPHFFVNNPHLISKMPAVAKNKVMVERRQKNLLSDIRTESLDKHLEYLKTRLRETGLADCVKEEFSGDMWEFEFFLFN